MSDLMELSEEFELEKEKEAKRFKEANFYQAISELEGMKPFEREAERKKISEKYNVRLTFIDKCIANNERKNIEADQNQKGIVEEIHPAAAPVDGSALLDEIMDKLYGTPFHFHTLYLCQLFSL